MRLVLWVLVVALLWVPSYVDHNQKSGLSMEMALVVIVSLSLIPSLDTG